MEFQFFLTIHKWHKGKLKSDTVEFYFLEEVFEHIKKLENFGKAIIKDIFGVVIHEQHCKEHDDDDHYA